MEPFYRSIIKRSWKISWKNKWLWVFGFFATFLGGGTLYETVLRSFSNLAEGRSIFFTINEYMNSGLFGMFSWTKLVDLWQTDSSALLISLFTLLILLIVGVIFIVLAVVSQASIVKSTIVLDEGEKTGFKPAFTAGVSHFWRVLALNILMKVVLLGLILFLAFLVSVFFFGPGLLKMFIYVIALVALVFLAIIVYFLTIYSTAFVVLRGRGVFASIRSAWQIFKRNVLINLEIGLILFVATVLFGICSLVLCVFILSPFILLYFLMLMLEMTGSAGIMSLVLLLLFAVIMAVIGSWSTVFQLSTWSVLFEELALKKGKSKIMRLFDAVFPVKKKKHKSK